MLILLLLTHQACDYHVGNKDRAYLDPAKDVVPPLLVEGVQATEPQHAPTNMQSQQSISTQCCISVEPEKGHTPWTLPQGHTLPMDTPTRTHPAHGHSPWTYTPIRTHPIMYIPMWNF